jgi:DNA-binding MarR family transcriptional regulator
MNSFEFLEKLGFSSNEAKVYGTLIKHKVLNGYEIAKLSGVARSLVYEVINRLIAKGAVIRIDGEPNFYKPIEYQDLIRSIKEENEYLFRTPLVENDIRVSVQCFADSNESIDSMLACRSDVTHDSKIFLCAFFTSEAS